MGAEDNKRLTRRALDEIYTRGDLELLDEIVLGLGRVVGLARHPRRGLEVALRQGRGLRAAASFSAAAAVAAIEVCSPADSPEKRL
jgi:hypothetical protein